MSRFDWNPLQETAEAMINNFGQNAVLKQKRKSGGTPTNPTYEESQMNVVIIDEGMILDAVREEQGGLLVQRERRKLLMSTSGVKESIAAVTEIERGAWSAPEVMTETNIASGDRDDFDPTGDSGVQATNLGIFAWYTEGNTLYLMLQYSDRGEVWYKSRTNNVWSDWSGLGTLKANETNANRNRDPLPTPNAIRIETNASENTANNLPPISPGSSYRRGILIDDATGQSLYYCNDQIPACQHYRRSIGNRVIEEAKTVYKIPNKSDVIVLANGEELVISEARKTSPGGIDLLYEIFVE